MGPESGFSATALARAEPPVIVSYHETERGFFYFDPCNLHPGEEAQVLASLAQVIGCAAPERGRGGPLAARLRWPD